MIRIYKMLKNLKRCVICFFEFLNNPGKVIDEIFYIPEVFNPLDKSEIDDILSKRGCPEIGAREAKNPAR